MKFYNNVYEYLRQTKLEGYWGMKKSGSLSLTEKMDLNTSFLDALNPGKRTSEDEAAVQKKLGTIRAKLRSGSRLSGAEKEYLRKHDLQRYKKVAALEEEQAAYEERLKKCHTRDEAERVKTEKLGEMAADLDRQDAEYVLVRLTQIRETEKKLASLVARKPWQKELDKKQLDAQKKAREKEIKALKKKLARKRRREEAARKEKMEEKLQQEALLKESITARMMEEENVQKLVEEQELLERQAEETAALESARREEMTEDQIAKFMIAAGMMDAKATKVQVADTAEAPPESPSVPASLGSTRGYAAYRAAAYMPELEGREEKKPYIRKA